MGYRILFVGGCHVNGAAADGDSKVAGHILRLLREDGYPCDPAYLIPIRLSHPRRLIQKCHEVKPDILVLQTGHPETSNLFGAYVKRMFGLSGRAGDAVDSSAGYTDSFDGSRIVRLKWFLRRNAKRLLDAATGHRLVSLPALAPVIERFFARAAALGVPHVIVLSPLPCADPVSMYYRRKLVPLLRAAAQRHGFDFVDVLETGNASWFLDPIHLNATGNRVIGELTAKHILCALQPLLAGQAG